MRAEALVVCALVLSSSLASAQDTPVVDANAVSDEDEASRDEADVSDLASEQAAAVSPGPESSERWLLEEAERALARGEREVAAYLLSRALRSVGPDGASADPPASPTGPVVVEPVVVEPVVVEPVVVESVVAPVVVQLEVHPWGPLFLEAGFVWGSAWIDAGMAADRARPSTLDERSPWTECDPRGEQCSVRVDQPGFGSTLAVRAALGVRPERWLGVALAVRAQPDAGQGALAGWLLELEGRARALDHEVVSIDVVAALGAGNVQVQPAQDDVDGPYVRSGPGFVSLALLTGVRVDPHVLIALDVRPRLAFPDLMFVLDVGLLVSLSP